jgi:hypothetical protein
MADFWTDRDWRINRMMWRFNRPGGFGERTWRYDEAPRAMREVIHRRTALEENEEGLVVYFHDAETWTLLTSERLIGKTKGTGFNMELRAIKDVMPDLYEGMMDADGNIRRRPVEKLNIASQQGSHRVCIEGPVKSGPYVGLWNAILMVMRASRR